MIKIFLKVIVLLVLLSNFDNVKAATAPFIPQNGKLLIVGQQMNTINEYLQSVNTVPGGFMFYTSIQNMDGLDSPADHGGGIMHAQYFIDRYPNTVIQLGLYMVGALDKTIAGQYDDNLLRMANWMKRIKRPIYLRIGYEFDLPDNKYDPQQYKQAYRYVVDRLRALGVTNVAYVWHSACMIEPLGNYMDWYPGDDYVDWFGVSLFNPMQIAVAKNILALAHGHNKPFMIAESSPAGFFSTKSKLEWFKHYFDFIKNNNVKIVCYINSDWNSYPLFKVQNWGDARVQSDPEIEDLWTKEAGNGFLESSPDLFDELNGE